MVEITAIANDPRGESQGQQRQEQRARVARHPVQRAGAEREAIVLALLGRAIGRNPWVQNDGEERLSPDGEERASFRRLKPTQLFLERPLINSGANVSASTRAGTC